LLIATGVNAVLSILAFLDKPGFSGIGWGFGAFVGLAAAIVAAARLLSRPSRPAATNGGSTAFGRSPWRR